MTYRSADTRPAKDRPHKQLKEKGESVNLSRLFRDIEERDKRDMNRRIAPLMPAEDAVHIDSTELSINDVMKVIYESLENNLITR